MLPYVHAGKIAIVIDDIGYHQRDLSAIDIPGELTFSILPHTPFADDFAIQARAKGKELMLHLPMEAKSGKALGPGGLTTTMTKHEFQTTLRHALSSMPGVRGVNNHMGSLLTAQTTPMEWTMDVLKDHQVAFFLDSKTTQHSKAQLAAEQAGIANVARHVFLDNIPSEEYIHLRFLQLARLAKQQDFAIAIAHPYPETLAYLKKALPTLAEQGIRLVPISELVAQKYANKKLGSTTTFALASE